MNEYIQTKSVFRALDGLVSEINELSGVPPVERYTYVYEQHTQELDHIFVSDAITRRGTEVEHIHVNTWAHSVSERASDHDPTVARVRICDRKVAIGLNGELSIIVFWVVCKQIHPQMEIVVSIMVCSSHLEFDRSCAGSTSLRIYAV